MDEGSDSSFSLSALTNPVAVGLAYGVAWGMRYMFDAWTKRQDARKAKDDAKEESQKEEREKEGKEEVTKRIRTHRRKK